ncbi:uncharacterized protein LOC117786974 [Drosophila innubila]|uniref:uncharacterized protein LOC117786974 n=1 Tax=Drosophila innubila TaxID=198719 RepID=UPI00148E2B07|nr:uncharacterized protein LOC117786974 [Drosophila innubila]
MHLLLFLLPQLTAIGPIGAQLARKPSALANSPSMEECINRMHVQNTNLKKIVECMARSANLTAFMEDTLWKLDLLALRLDRLEAIQSPEVYVRSPYVQIDDVLKIEGSVAGYNCEGKQQVVQAIRRKLEHSHLINGRVSELFDWPSSRISAGNKVPPKFRTFDGNLIKEVKTGVKEIKELSCLISEAIERHAKPIKKSNIG